MNGSTQYPINPARERDGLVSKYLKEMVFGGTQINNEFMKTKEGSNPCAHVLYNLTSKRASVDDNDILSGKMDLNVVGLLSCLMKKRLPSYNR